MPLKRLGNDIRQHGYAVLLSFPITDEDLGVAEIDIFDP
jgi:hypothetical protein